MDRVVDTSRPRGGWQVGGARGKKPQEGRRTHIGPYSPENPDPAPDVYAVVRGRTDRSFVISHYRHVDDTKPCCLHVVTPLPIESDEDALARADRELLALPCHGRYWDATGR